jgi:hypothetical protein
MDQQQTKVDKILVTVPQNLNITVHNRSSINASDTTGFNDSAAMGSYAAQRFRPPIE